MVKEQLTRVFKREVNFSTVKLSPLLALEIKDLDIQDFAKIDKVSISPVIVGFSKGKIVLGQLNLFRPKLSIGKSAEGGWNLPEGILEKFQNKNDQGPQPALLSGLLIKDGSLNFTDESQTPAFSFSIKNINLDVGNKILSFNPILTRFRFYAEIITQDKRLPTVLSARGWIDFLQKDMKGMIELSDLDAVYFLPLYGKFLTTNIKSGILTFKSDLVAKSNDLVANCRLAIKDLVFDKGKDETAPNISFFDIVAGGLQTENKEVNVDFVIQTKLDKPKVDFVKLSGTIVAKALGEQMIQSPQRTIENIKSVGKEFEKIGKDFLKNKLGIDITGKEEDKNETPLQNATVSP